MRPTTTLLVLIFGCQLTFAQLQSFRPTTDFSGFLFGDAIDIDGNEIIVSSSSMMSVNSLGKVYLFVKNANGIEQQQTLFQNSLLYDDWFGNSIAIHNDFIAIGATGDDSTASNAGAVYLYQKVGGSYEFLQKITAPDGMINDYFGNNVTLYNNQLFIAANGFGLDTSFGNGAVYVYNFNGTTWTYSEKLTVPNTNALGRKIEVENETLVVSSDEGGQRIHTFRWDGTHWAFGNTNGENPWEGITDFTLSNNRLFLLKIFEFPPQGVSVFNNSNGNWVNPTTLDLSNPSSSDQVYTEIAVNGDDMFLGSNQYILQMTRKFPVLHYQKNSAAWEYQNTYYSDAPEGLDDQFGSCIASKGDIAIFGSPFEEIPFSGNAYYLDMTLGSPTFEKNTTLAYPNPTHDVVYIQNDASVRVQRIEVYSTTGHLLQTECQHTDKVSLAKLATGIYFLKTYDQNKTVDTFKIIKN